MTAYNTPDIDAVMALFSAESEVTFHPLAASAAGVDAIRELQISDIEHAAAEGAYKFSNVVVSGSAVTWDHVWVDRQGNERCGYGNETVIENGRVLSWAFAPGPYDCR